jgi:hypothetical protein
MHIYIYLPMSPTSVGLSSVLLRFIDSMGNLSLLATGDYYYRESHNKDGGKEMVTGQGYGICIGEYNRLCPTAMGHSLVALFFLSVSIKDRPLHGPWSSHRLMIPSTYLLMGAGRLITLLS